jgi:hypothetical protein
MTDCILLLKPELADHMDYEGVYVTYWSSVDSKEYSHSFYMVNLQVTVYQIGSLSNWLSEVCSKREVCPPQKDVNNIFDMLYTV